MLTQRWAVSLRLRSAPCLSCSRLQGGSWPWPWSLWGDLVTDGGASSAGVTPAG